MKFYLFFFLISVSSSLFAQKIIVQGFVIDKDSKARLAKVFIYNSSNDEGIYNNLKGEFTIKAKVGDTIFTALRGYAMDTAV